VFWPGGAEQPVQFQVAHDRILYSSADAEFTDGAVRGEASVDGIWQSPTHLPWATQRLRHDEDWL